MQTLIEMRTLFTALTATAPQFTSRSIPQMLPLFDRYKILHETYVSGYHLFEKKTPITKLQEGDILDVMIDSNDPNDLSSAMLLHGTQPIGFLPIYENEVRIGKLPKGSALKAKITCLNPKGNSWEKILIELMVCE